jgi:hypothetical protein
MSNRFMMSVAAAALIAGTGFANAQGVGMGHEAPSAGAAQQSAPSPDRAGSATTPMGHESAEQTKPSSDVKTKPSSDMKAVQSEKKSPAAGVDQRAEDNPQGQKPSGKGTELNENTKAGAGTMKTEGREDRSGAKAENSEDRNSKMNAESKGTAENKSETVGQAGGGAKLSSEQRTKISTVIREQHVQPTENVNFSISVGTRVPRDVEFHPLPAEILSVYPDWRGYEFILVRDEILVINPRTLEIVAVIET